MCMLSSQGLSYQYLLLLSPCKISISFQVRITPLFVRIKVYYLAKIGHVVILLEVPRMLLLPL